MNEAPAVIVLPAFHFDVARPFQLHDASFHLPVV